MRSFLVILVTLFLASCAAKKQAAEYEALPDWVKQKPIINGYYVGVASVKKVGTSAQYIAKARQEALTDLAESVSSSVSSTSVLHSIETEYGMSETYDQKIQISTDDYLEGFEPVDSYENESAYWVYYKIAKSTYHEMKEKKKQEAISTAIAKYESGLQEQNINKPKEALAFYLQGLQAIKRYLNEETPANLQGEKVDIGNELYSSASQILNSLSIEAGENEITIKRGESFKNNLEFIVRYANKPVQGIPVEFKYTGGYLKNDKKISDASGNVFLQPEVLYSKNQKEQIIAEINLKDLAQKSVDDVFIRGLILKRKLQSASVNVLIESPTTALSIDKNSCTDYNCEQINNLFNQNAKQFGYDLNGSNLPDFRFELSFGFKKGESAGGLFSVYLSGEILIKDKSGNLIWTKQTEDIKGVGNSIQQAKSKAFDDFLTALNRKYFKQGFEEIK
jgi:hypothetical protein